MSLWHKKWHILTIYHKVFVLICSQEMHSQLLANAYNHLHFYKVSQHQNIYILHFLVMTWEIGHLLLSSAYSVIDKRVGGSRKLQFPASISFFCRTLIEFRQRRPLQTTLPTKDLSYSWSMFSRKTKHSVLNYILMHPFKILEL